MVAEAGAWGLPVVENPNLRRGVVLSFAGRLVVGTRPPTEIQQLVMDGFAAAHPWFRDPMRADPMAALRLAT